MGGRNVNLTIKSNVIIISWAQLIFFDSWKWTFDVSYHTRGESMDLWGICAYVCAFVASRGVQCFKMGWCDAKTERDYNVTHFVCFYVGGREHTKTLRFWYWWLCRWCRRTWSESTIEQANAGRHASELMMMWIELTNYEQHNTTTTAMSFEWDVKFQISENNVNQRCNRV